MYYLTYEEYEALTTNPIAAHEFNDYLPKAAAVLDNITNHFYVKNGIKEDNAWRAKQFKWALCAQIEYFDEVGSATFEGINKEPQSFTAGRTTVTNASRFNPSGANESKPLVAEDVYTYLEGTGLLYRGIGVVR